MLHSYVAIMVTKPGSLAAERTKQRVSARLKHWVRALETDLACVWVQRTQPSQLGWRKFGADGCLIGLDFHDQVNSSSVVLDQSWGAYVAIQVDIAKGDITVTRDPTGRIEAWRLSLDGVDVFFSHYEYVYWLQDRQPGVNWDYLGHHLSQDYMHGADTGIDGVTELLPGEAIVYRDGQCNKEMRWWPHRIAAAPHATIDDAISALRGAAERSVEAWASRYDRMGLYLSGGLDSAIVLGLLKQRQNDRHVVAINHSFAGREGDERPFARLAAEMHNAQLIEEEPYATNIGFSQPFSRRLMRPRARLLTTGNDRADAELASDLGLKALFTGTGGDHLFYEGLPIGAASDYLHHGGSLTGFIDVSLDIARLSRNTVWAVLAQAGRHRLGPRANIRALYGVRNAFLSEDGKAAADFDRFTHPWIAAAADEAPPAKLRQICYLTELQRHYSRYGLADTIEEVHPLFSQPLIEASLATPAYWFALDGVQRGLARRAFGDLLPQAIRERRSKGASTTYVLDFLGRSLPRIRELLLEGHLARHGLLDRAAVERALTPLGLAAAKDFPALFTCLPTELWIQQMEADRTAAMAGNTALEKII